MWQRRRSRGERPTGGWIRGADGRIIPIADLLPPPPMDRRRRLRLAALRTVGWLIRRLLPVRRSSDPAHPRILAIRPDHLGDVLLSRPAIEALAAVLPEARITVAVGPWGRDALGAVPGHEVRIVPFPGFSRTQQRPWQPYLLLARYALRLRREVPFDLALVLRSDHWWGALLAALAGIPVRIGFVTPESTPFITDRPDLSPGWSPTIETLSLAEVAARRIGGEAARDRLAACWLSPDDAPRPILPTVATEDDDLRMATLLSDAGFPAAAPLLVLHPGSGSRLKSWPLERFALVGLILAAERGMRVVVTGSAAERDLAQRLCDLLPSGSLNLAGVLSWGELEALLTAAELVVGVDSGPLHLAVAAGTPSVALFGPASVLQFMPWGPRERHLTIEADLPCVPCRRLDLCHIEPDGEGPPPCMRALEAHEVVEMARELLDGEDPAYGPLG